MYLVAYVGSKRVRERPLNYVIPDIVKKRNKNINKAMINAKTTLLRAINYSSCKFFLTISIKT